MKNKLESQISDLTVIKDSLLFKVLVKLVAKQERAVKDGSDTFAYSLNEFRLDLQIGKATLVRKFEKLEQLAYLEVIKNIAIPEGRKQSHYLKTDYKVNLAAINALIKDLAPLSQIERVEHINTMLCVMTPKSLYSIKVKEEPVKQEKVNDKPKKNSVKQEILDLNPVEVKTPIYADFIKKFPSGTLKKEAEVIMVDILNQDESMKTLEYLCDKDENGKDGWDKLRKADKEHFPTIRNFIWANFSFSEYFDKQERMVS
ncbi:MAG: hypothetical protein LBQ22_08120 [Bacteroidales bacterium]|jgi:hypothetical protein|nr:hypothetical protein [Bacteroidales bacterium]